MQRSSSLVFWWRSCAGRRRLVASDEALAARGGTLHGDDLSAGSGLGGAALSGISGQTTEHMRRFAL